MKIVGVDLHAKQQSIAMLDTDTGELTEKQASVWCPMVWSTHAGKPSISECGLLQRIGGLWGCCCVIVFCNCFRN
jgi:hypothetical protein